ncbi:hypothetical protein F5Y08DRAFT_277872 [Xylaria arbuscula]|nr:hypothetical protein F5Y08DRAFT_277872 [Xylaria arbuscula]
MMEVRDLAFVMHAAVETAAAISFIVQPEQQLPGCTPAAKLILRQYGGLLLASSMICMIVVASPGCSANATRLLAAALGSYHVWPCFRASARLRHQAQYDTHENSVFGGPLVHLLVHSVCLGLFLYAAIAQT